MLKFSELPPTPDTTNFSEAAIARLKGESIYGKSTASEVAYQCGIEVATYLGSVADITDVRNALARQLPDEINGLAFLVGFNEGADEQLLIATNGAERIFQ